MLNLGMNLQRLAVKGGLQFTPASLFNNGEAGVWYDPSAASGSLDWRRNLLQYTESFDNTIGWAKGINTVITPNASTYNGSSASRVQMPASAGTYVMAPVQLIEGVKYTFSIYLKNNGSPDLNVGVGTSVNSGITEGVNYTVTNEWVRYVYVYTAATSSQYWFGVDNRSNSTAVDVYAWGAQVEEASTASSYQPILSTFESAFKAANPNHTLYQDYQGLTPVTAVGEPVGLMLDKSEGLKRGPELVTNGDFSNGTTGWTATGGATATAVNGELVVSDGVGLYSRVRQDVLIPSGNHSYILTINARVGTGTSFDIRIGNNVGSQTYGSYTGVTSTSSQQYSIIFTPTESNQDIYLFLYSNDSDNGGTAIFDNVSLKEIQGSHATQPTSTKRPIYARHPEGGIRNLLNYTEQFDNSYWAKGSNSTLTPNAIVAPDGTQTAYALTNIGSSGSSFIGVQTIGTSGKGYTVSVYAKAGTNNTIRIGNVSSTVSACWFNLTDGTIGTDNGAGNTSSIQDVGNGWYRCTRYFASWAVGGTELFVGNSLVDGSFQPPSTPKNVYLWGAQFEEATEASNYQKVVTDIDVTESGVGEVYYLKFDGTDDSLVINNLSSSNTPITALFGYSATNMNTANYVWLLDITAGRTIFGSQNAINSLGYYDDQWSQFSADADSIKVLTYDLIENDAKIRVDGTQEYSDTTYDQKAIGGNISLFSRYDGLSAFLAGNMYQTILRAAESTDEEIAKAETYVANKTGLKAQVDGIATLDLNFGANTYTAKNSNGGVI